MARKTRDTIYRRSTSDGRILQAARSLFLARGSAGVNMDLIAVEAGVARQTIYNRFGSKEAVFKAAIAAHWETLSAKLSCQFSLDEKPDRVLRDVADTVLDFIERYDQVAMTRMVIAESFSNPALAETFFELGKQPIRAKFVDYLEQANEHGILSCIHPSIACDQYLGMIQETLLWPRVMGLPVEGIANDSVIDDAIETFLARYQPLKLEHQ